MESDVQNDAMDLERRDVAEAPEDEAPELMFGEDSGDTGVLRLRSQQHIGRRAAEPLLVPVVAERRIALLREHL